MLLKDINGSKREQFRKLNHIIKSRFGFSVSENTSVEKIDQSLVIIENEIRDLKEKTTLRESAAMSKFVLMRDALSLLRESAVPEVTSNNPYRAVIDWLSNAAADAVTLGDAYDDAIRTVMKEYRSSKWRYPDERVEADVRAATRQNLISQHKGSVAAPSTLPVFESVSITITSDNIAEIISWLESKVTDAPAELSAPVNDKLTATYGSDADIEDNAFASVYAPSMSLPKFQSNKVNEMKENAIKRLRTLLETEVAEAEIIATARSFASEVQEMIEKLSRLQNEDLPPLTDSMKEEYGIAIANDFHSKSQVALQGALEALYSAKDEIDNSVISLATGESNTDMDADISANPEFSADPSLGTETDFDAIEDEFGGAEVAAGELDEPLGRVKKESIRNLKKKIMEMENRLATLTRASKKAK